MSKNAKEHVGKGWEAILARDVAEAERLFTLATKESPEDADGWNGLGAVHFERGELKESLACYEKAKARAVKQYGGMLPDVLSWEEDRPALRALHGIGLNRYRMGDLDDAKAAFEDLLRRNPDDNQGVQFLLADVKKKKDLWKKDE